MIRKEKNDGKKYVLGLFIIILMISSALALFSDGDGQDNNYPYNGYNFYLNQEGYVVEVEGIAYYFDFLPGDVENMDFEVYPFSTDKIYIDANNESKDVVVKLETLFVSRGILPVIEKRECNEGLVVIKLIDGENNKVYIENACIVLEGNIYKTSDRFAYWYLGII